MEYKILNEADRNSVVKDYLRSQEVDYYCHTLNAERYRNMLADPTLPDGEFKEKVMKLLSETEERMAEVGLIIKHTVKQLPVV